MYFDTKLQAQRVREKKFSRYFGTKRSKPTEHKRLQLNRVMPLLWSWIPLMCEHALHSLHQWTKTFALILITSFCRRKSPTELILQDREFFIGRDSNSNSFSFQHILMSVNEFNTSSCIDSERWALKNQNIPIPAGHKGLSDHLDCRCLLLKPNASSFFLSLLKFVCPWKILCEWT